LLYHVSNGNLASSQFMAGGTTGSALSGITRRFIARGNDLYINGSKIVITNVAASNGTVHAIDKVMLATGANIVASAQAVAGGGVFKTRTYILVAAVVKSGLAPHYQIQTIISQFMLLQMLPLLQQVFQM
jgi:hypothetical protein